MSTKKPPGPPKPRKPRAKKSKTPPTTPTPTTELKPDETPKLRLVHSAPSAPTPPASGTLSSLPTISTPLSVLPAVRATHRDLPPTGSVSATVRRVLHAKAEHAWRYGWSYAKYLEEAAEDRSLDPHGGATVEAVQTAWADTAAEWAESARAYDPKMAREGTRRRLLSLIEKELDGNVKVSAEKLLAQVSPGVLAPNEVKTEHSGGPLAQVTQVLVTMSEAKLKQIMGEFSAVAELPPQKLT